MNLQDLGFVKDILVTGDSMRDVPNYTMVGYFRMYFRNGWVGKWFPENDGFAKNGTTENEGGVLKKFCQWVEKNFKGGCDKTMVTFLEENTDYVSKQGGRFYLGINIDETSYAVAMFSTEYGNGDYPVRIYLYRKVAE